MWWQTRPGHRPADRERWMADSEDEFGPWGKLYADEGRVIGLIQYGPADRFARARQLPAGPPSRDAVLVTCAYLTDANSPWVLQSLFLAAIGECRDRGLPALEAFGYQYPSGETFEARFLGHRTIFPSDFLHDLGFHPQRNAGKIELARLDLRAIEPVPEESRLARLRTRLSLASASPAGVR
jgi:hypothetical protein